MPQTRRLLHEEITYSVAKEKQVNVLRELQYFTQRAQFFDLLKSKQSWIQAVVAHHLNLKSTDACRLADTEEWVHGSFNVCIPVTVFSWAGAKKSQPGDRVIIRFPLPYRVGEEFRPGNADEKLRCEAGTYAWLEGTCPDIPIPRLYGFAMSTGETFTRIDCLPFLSSWWRCLSHHILSLFGCQVPSKYSRHQRKNDVLERNRLNDVGYLLIEYIEESRGRMLSSTWAAKKDDTKLRTNLLRDLSKIYLSLCKTPLPKIGSLLIDNDGILQLANRPLNMTIQILENECIPTDMPRGITYERADTFVADILTCHDNRLRHQPNAIESPVDYFYQAARLTAMRTIAPLFLSQDLRQGPFIYSLTDLHASNIFVDDDWHITSLVDLEWACSLPIEMVQLPYWISGATAIDCVDYHEHNEVQRTFVEILAAEEDLTYSCSSNKVSSTPLKLSQVMDRTWKNRMFWYHLALETPTGLWTIFDREIQPPLIKGSGKEHGYFGPIMTYYWTRNTLSILHGKMKDKEAYDTQLQHEFEETT
ncbi:uncharacterized protein DSM5745_04952 [Aspergillus mulundensis]|uniref:Aminoglycoside phosphotransferase domain-containing protein n=1 Tax=Aspergillus mulundensis TaxID=1810919 RepID=A0A3D8S520_9EURO|nr:Uncharacterized protein DSM5745_04952 [Aspergillus mulundensis]RDW81395.1 Uncharacterized protein DSM5745_04952 [Aspergillus mulundensis]